MLQEVCSEALAEHRGIYKKVGERTIRDDIRVMKSDMLGFNAPIVVEGGYYSYSDPSYSIFNATTSEKELLKEVLMMLLEVRDKLIGKSPLRVISDLADLTGVNLPVDIKWRIQKEIKRLNDIQFMILDNGKSKSKKDIKETKVSSKKLPEVQFIKWEREEIIKFSWRRILELV